MKAHKSGVRQIFGNLFALLSGKAAAGVISLGYLVIAARMLGVTEYGVLNLIHGYVTLVGGIIAFSGWHGLVRYG
ncbi:MAG: lipopolysaccharide biosynthesis protein, partial [Alphaproteobacteria bacterium]|nr:lipopolysaccharide biosynthesis protein [Alphaproteobacteria bacterium]